MLIVNELGYEVRLEVALETVYRKEQSLMNRMPINRPT